MKRIKYLAIIPARKGSKGLPNKNKKLLGGIPLIEWTIKAALNSNKITETILTTDDEDIITLASRYKIMIPFKRPNYLAKDNTGMIDVIIHVLTYFEKKNFEVENIILLQPTSPFRTSTDIDNAIKKYEHEKAKRLISVSKPIQHPYDFVYFENNKLVELNKEETKRRQAYKKFYFIDGGIYISNKEEFLKTKSFIKSDTKIFLISRDHAFDIDDEFDFQMAQAWLGFMNNLTEESKNG